MAETRLMDIYKHLSNSGIETYFPAQKCGECLNTYAVVKDAGTMKYPGLSSTQSLVDILCYAPKNKFTTLDQFVSMVENHMKALQPMIMPTYFRTPSFYDDSIKGYMISIQYRYSKKI